MMLYFEKKNQDSILVLNEDKHLRKRSKWTAVFACEKCSRSPESSFVLTCKRCRNKSARPAKVLCEDNASWLTFFSAGNPRGVRLHPLPPARGDITQSDRWWIPERSPPVIQQTENSSSPTWWMLPFPHTLFDPKKDGQLAVMFLFLTLSFFTQHIR